MDKEAIKSLVIDLLNLKDLTMEDHTELELKYQIQDNFISELWSEIKRFKGLTQSTVTADLFNTYLEEHLRKLQEQYQSYRSSIHVEEMDKEDYLNLLNYLEERINTFERFLGQNLKENINQKCISR